MKHRNGFTLIELLVVISIISLLISILLPALAKARQTARAIVCSSQLRQIVTAAHIYGAENDDYLPGYRWYYPKRIGNVMDYMNVDPAAPVEQESIMTCAESQKQWAALTRWKRTYAWNEHALSINVSGTPMPKPVKFNEIAKPSEMSLVNDGVGKTLTPTLGWWYDTYHDWDTVGWNDADNYLHNGSVNVAYADGHGAGVNQTQIDEMLTATNLTFWNGR